MLKKYFITVFLCLLILFGCKPSNPYGTVPVRGNITMDGKAIQGITVTFRPVSGNGVSAYGLTDDQGNYVLTTGGAPFGTGAIPGKYHVILSKITNSEPQLTVDEYNAQESSGTPPSNSLMPANRVTHLIPEKYLQPETSGLEPVDVQAKGKNVFDFRLVE